jgi:hypothetical protein
MVSFSLFTSSGAFLGGFWRQDTVKMLYEYNKPFLEKILAELTAFESGKEEHHWRFFRIYNGKPIPFHYEIESSTYEKRREEFLQKVHSMNGNISRIELDIEGDKRLLIGIRKPLMQVEYEGAIISCGFAKILEQYRDRELQVRKRGNTTVLIRKIQPDYVAAE